MWGSRFNFANINFWGLKALKTLGSFRKNDRKTFIDLKVWRGMVLLEIIEMMRTKKPSTTSGSAPPWTLEIAPLASASLRNYSWLWSERVPFVLLLNCLMLFMKMF